MFENFDGRLIHAVNAGLCAAAANFFGKWSGMQDYSTYVSTVILIYTPIIFHSFIHSFISPVDQ
jgi:hypothetical protein